MNSPVQHLSARSPQSAQQSADPFEAERAGIKRAGIEGTRTEGAGIEGAQLDEAQRLRALAALGDPVRKKLFELVRDADAPLSRDDCAEELGLPKSTIRAHLDRLVKEQLLTVEFRKIGDRTGPGSGRPTKLYAAARREISASVPPRHYDLAASLLAAGVQRSIESGEGIEASLAEVAHQEGMRMGQVAGDIHTLLLQNGYSPEPDDEGGTIMANCPFHRLSQDHQGVVCSLNGSLLSGALEGCGDDRHDLAPDVEISHCCARLVPKAPQ